MGQCTKIVSRLEVPTAPPESNAALLDASYGEYSDYLLTGPKFGCALHQPDAD